MRLRIKVASAIGTVSVHVLLRAVLNLREGFHMSVIVYQDYVEPWPE
jgi:hypothetical protein